MRRARSEARAAGLGGVGGVTPQVELLAGKDSGPLFPSPQATRQSGSEGGMDHSLYFFLRWALKPETGGFLARVGIFFLPLYGGV